jgi:SAM-dependent MidA family methyltransferase
LPVSLTERLREAIRREGAITFHDWMKAALYDPHGGYYQRSDRERWGREGDYRTSPGRSELFAATFARYFARLYDELGRPETWKIVECGAGDGRFAAGVLHTLANQFPKIFAATQYVVQEVSEDARGRMRERLSVFPDRVEFRTDVPRIEAGICFSNELLDAFPVHRVVKNGVALSELYVTISDDGGFAWNTGPLSTPRLSEFFSSYSLDLADGQVVEINLEIDDWLAQLAEKLEQGFLITVDYGAEAGELYDFAQRPNGTLRGFARHGFVDDVLGQPGECDLTASVNWTQVKRAGERLGLKVIDFAPQDKFLLNAGFLEQLEYRLGTAKTEAEKLSLTTGAREMILPGGMASSFQVLVQKRMAKGV